MKYSWSDYTTNDIKLVEGFLDDEAVLFTGCDDGWNSFYEYWKNEPEMALGKNFWCKVVSEADVPIAAIAFSVCEDILTVMEIVVAPGKRNHGYGSAILTELLHNGAEILGFDIRRAKAVIYPNNFASQKLFRKVGFVFDHALADNDAYIYSYRKPCDQGIVRQADI